MLRIRQILKWVLVFSCLSQSRLSAQRVAPAPYTSSYVNFVRTWDVMAPVSVPDTVLNLPLKDVRQTTQYFDGLGRLAQTVLKQGSLNTGGSATDLVIPITYDQFGREVYKYLPFAANNTGGNSSINDGLFKFNPFQQDSTFNKGMFSDESWYYSQVKFEASPLNRPLETFAPGNSWVGTSGQANEINRRSIKAKYWVNTSIDSVRIWNVTDVANAFGTYSTTAMYPAGALFKNVTADVTNNQVIEFTDKEGQVILKKVQLTAAADNEAGKGHYGWLCTYYVYDGLHNLRCVIQPRGVELLAANGWDINALSGDILKEQCFRYEYDTRSRMIRKKVPGAGNVLMIYDKWDRLVLTQDSGLRSQNKWLFTKYDQLNRPIITGFYTNATYTTQSAMQGYLDGQNLGRYENYQTSSWPLYTTNLTFPVNSISDARSITYYDDYSWGGWYGGSFGAKDNSYDSYFASASNSTWPYPQALTQSPFTKGMVTGAWDVAGPGLLTASYYDDKGRVIQTKHFNFSQGIDISTIQYSFIGQPLQTYLHHQKGSPNAQTHDVITKMEYDDLGRLATVKKNIDNTGEKTLLQNEYDNLGQLKKKTLSNTIDTCRYDYNIRGWLLGMNREFVKDNATNKFGFELGYDKAGTIISGANYTTPQYNGNISGMIWKSTGDNQKRKYDFTYDAVNRLTGADFNQWTSGSTFNKSAGIDFSVSGLAYDANGNILFMKQVGWKPVGSGTLDSLTYNYYSNSNRLKNVVDGVNDVNTKLGDFRSSSAYMGVLGAKTNSATDYTYDGNGNMVKDLNKDISYAGGAGINYNYLNLPESIFIEGKGSIEYIYSHGGAKLKKIVHETGKPDKSTLYIGGFVYENDTLQFTGHEEGRIRYAKQYYTNGDSAWRFMYDYFLKDHLGNVRMVLTEQKDTAKYIATMEAPYRAKENALFYNIPQSSYPESSVGSYPTDPNQTTPHDSLIRVNGSAQKIGPTLVLKVMSGDKVDVKAVSFYHGNGSAGSNNNAINDILSSLAYGIVGIAGETKGTLSQLNNTGTSPLLGALNSFRTANNSDPSGKPKAYLNWILLDEQFNYVSTSSGAILVGDTGMLNTLANTGITMNKNGFLYIYVSNETQNWDVFFDNLSVNHYTGPLLEETHYYPFGLTMAGISSKALKPNYVENKYKYNGIELNNSFSLNMYDAQYRNIDPQIGRFWQVDPKPVDSISPYAIMYNNPIRYTDPLGDTIVVNLFNNDAHDRTMYNAANAAVSRPTNDGVFLVFGHANSYLLQYPQDNGQPGYANTANGFNSAMAERSPEYKEALEKGDPISLTINACNVASEEFVAQNDISRVIVNPNPIAEQVSNSLPKNSTVTAPDGYIWFGNVNGKPGILGVQETSAQQPRNTNHGGFVTYQNGQVINKQEMPFTPSPAQLRSLKKDH